MFDAGSEQAAVGFELGFTRAAQADAAFLPLQVRPAAHQAGGKVVQLGEFDLQFAFVTAGTLREDVEHQAAAVKDARAAQFFEVTFLRGGKRGVDDDEFDVVRFYRCGQGFRLTTANVVAWLDFAPAEALGKDDLCAGREGELVKFFFDGGIGDAVDVHLDEGSAFAAFWSFKQNAPPVGRKARCCAVDALLIQRIGTRTGSFCRGSGVFAVLLFFFTFFAFAGDAHVARRDDG